VVKLDLRLIQGRTTAEIARTMGATIGQGYLYGRPEVLPSGSRPTRARSGGWRHGPP
jgi:EAL domain-containing protein (putative c-di-GMP-specific phosphodiesterase class I)